MNIARTINVLRNRNINQSLVRKFRISAANYESSQAAQPQVQEEKYGFEDLKVLERTERRKEKIQPFMKDVFVSVFNRNLLAYPEILNKDETAELNLRIENLEKVFKDPEKTAEDRKDALKRTRMYGAPVSLTKNGLAMNATESLRYLETISSDIPLSQQLSEHWVALNALQIGLQKDQFDNIVDDLISGDQTIALCIKERVAERISQPDFRTKAELDSRGVWRITGEKLSTKHDGHFLVLAATEANRLMVFLVHPQAEGIAQDGVTVSFMKTPGTPLSLCSEQEMAQKLGLYRLYTSALTRCSVAKTLQFCSDYVHTKSFSGKPLAELSTIKCTFGDALLHIYASESAQYFTAGLMDGYKEPDVEMELAMCRNYQTIHAMRHIVDLLSLASAERPTETDQLMDEARRLLLRGETLFSVNMYIAMNGIHHAGKQMAEEIKQIRNPLFNPTFIMKKFLQNRHQEKDDPKLTLYLAEHLHPSLKPSADELEYCVLRMKYACETIMSRHGVDIATAYTELNRLAEAATEILHLTAVLARASRSYCIGVQNAEVEMKLAASFVSATKERVRKLILEIDDGEYLNLDHFRVQFGKKVLDSKSLVVQPAIARVFW